MNKISSACVYINAMLVAVLSLYSFIAPAVILAQDLSEPALSSGDVPRFAYRWHRKLSGDFETWARQRVASGKAKQLNVQDIAGTEWPVFSSVFYLWTTESLQAAWEADPSLAPAMPKEYARGAIEAAAALVSDPNHAAWVRQHWGDDYLQRENLFYRMLLISGLTSYQKLRGGDRYEPLLRDQVESLSAEIDRSPYGLLDDYPGECYPIDILPAIAAIRRADRVLGADHAAFAARAVRGFEGARLDPDTDLPAYVADSTTGLGVGPARGVGVSFMLTWSPELWPETTRRWYTSYEKHFWQQGQVAAGIREFPRESSHAYPEWYLLDVDAGPVVAGYGTAASAFGIGATRVNGRMDQAYLLSAEALVASWPLPDGTLVTPRLLSVVSDAPYVGETILLFNLTRRPVTGTVVLASGAPPLAVYLGIAAYASTGIALTGSAIVAVRRWQRHVTRENVPISNRTLAVRSALCLLGVVIAIFVSPLLGLPVLLCAELLGARR